MKQLCYHCMQYFEGESVCPHCGHVMDRDEQAAVNIDIEGMRVFLTERPPISKDCAA